MNKKAWYFCRVVEIRLRQYSYNIDRGIAPSSTSKIRCTKSRTSFSVVLLHLPSVSKARGRNLYPFSAGCVLYLRYLPCSAWNKLSPVWEGAIGSVIVTSTIISLSEEVFFMTPGA